jgi:hypothetical protein
MMRYRSRPKAARRSRPSPYRKDIGPRARADVWRERVDCAGAVAPLIAGQMSTDLRAVHTGPGCECRNRNGAAIGKLSADAVAQAIDISDSSFQAAKSFP